MRIIRTTKRYKKLLRRKERAEKEMGVCPNCGAVDNLSKVSKHKYFGTDSTRWLERECWECGTIWKSKTYKDIS